MKKVPAWLTSVLRLGLGFAIIALILRRILFSSVALDIPLPPGLEPPAPGAIYALDGLPAVQVTVLDVPRGGASARASVAGDWPAAPVSPVRLSLVSGSGPAVLEPASPPAPISGARLFGAVLAQAVSRWYLLLAAHLLFFSCLLAGVFRWHLILEAQNIRLPLRRTFSVFFIGHFFNSFFLGSTGGDVVKSYYAARETHTRKTEAVAAVFIDRLVGLIALVFLVAVMLVFRAPVFLGNPTLRPAGAFLLAVVLVAFAGVFLLFRRDMAGSRRWQALAARPGRIGTAARTALRVYASFYLCRSRPGLLAKTLLLSLYNHIGSLAGCHICGLAIQAGLPALMSLTIFPALGAIASIPITPGGLGVREGAAVVLFGAIGIPHMKAFLLSFLPYLSMLAWSLFGGGVFLVHSHSPGHSLKEEIHAIEEAEEEPLAPAGDEATR